jgi:YVTN family beta-propeller protein
VANSDSYTVSVIATATNTVVATVPVGSAPGGVAITPSGAFAYVTNGIDNTVSVIATATNTVVATVPVKNFPFGVAITPDGAFAYVADSHYLSMSVIATATNTVANTFEAYDPNSVAITPNGAYAYVTSPVGFINNSVSVVATATQTVVATIPLAAQPVGVAITSDGAYAYVAEEGANSVLAIATATNTVVATVPVGFTPMGVAITPPIPGTVPTITSPTPGSVLPSDFASFSWMQVSGATKYQLNVGTSAGAANVFTGTTTSTSQPVGFIPCTGETIYVALSAYVDGSFQPGNDYTYVCGTVVSDFKRDGHADVIWEEPTIGWAQIWYLGGTYGVSLTGAANVTQANPWHIVGVADFNGDGAPDVVWQDPVSGAVQVWYLDGTEGNVLMGAADITTRNPWQVVSVADFNQDGHPDLLGQDPNSGWAQIWYLGGPQGTTLLGAANLTKSNPWRVVGSADFNGDGFPDVLWQDPDGGTVQIWYLGGTTPGSQGSVFQSAENLVEDLGTAKVVAVADFNQDGHPDVVVQDPATGAATVYFYIGPQGTTYYGSVSLSMGNPWYIAGPH